MVSASDFNQCQSCDSPGFKPQSNELTRGTTELIQHFRLKGEFTRRKGAVLNKFDMVWLYRSPIPVEGRRVFHWIKLFILATLRGRGGGSAPCGSNRASSDTVKSEGRQMKQC
jgi:hypothetical protein